MISTMETPYERMNRRRAHKWYEFKGDVRVLYWKNLDECYEPCELEAKILQNYPPKEETIRKD